MRIAAHAARRMPVMHPASLPVLAPRVSRRVLAHHVNVAASHRDHGPVTDRLFATESLEMQVLLHRGGDHSDDIRSLRVSMKVDATLLHAHRLRLLRRRTVWGAVVVDFTTQTRRSCAKRSRQGVLDGARRRQVAVRQHDASDLAVHGITDGEAGQLGLMRRRADLGVSTRLLLVDPIGPSLAIPADLLPVELRPDLGFELVGERLGAAFHLVHQRRKRAPQHQHVGLPRRARSRMKLDQLGLHPVAFGPDDRRLEILQIVPARRHAPVHLRPSVRFGRLREREGRGPFRSPKRLEWGARHARTTSTFR
mmetsp:Transcript_35289/g.94517  ORF Transcript_35289/g.94517 Transcript_35289/m.94517 type:complete len:309 (+) Transcript_35289:88-1014(+)